MARASAAQKAAETDELGSTPANGPISTVPEWTPDFAKIEGMLGELAAERAPLVLRQDIERERAAERAREIEAAIETVRSRRALLDRLYQTVCEGLEAEREDLEAALAILQHGFVGASTET